MTCERIYPRSGKRCDRPSSRVLLVQLTGEEVSLCEQCAYLYEHEREITYVAKDGRRLSWDGPVTYGPVR